MTEENNRFISVAVEDKDHPGGINSAAYDRLTDKVAVGLDLIDVLDLNVGAEDVEFWGWDNASDWKIIEPEPEPTLHYSFPNWLYTLVESKWDEAIDRPKEFAKLSDKMQAAVLGTVQRALDDSRPTA